MITKFTGFIFIAFLVCTTTVSAQFPAGGNRGGTAAQGMTMGHFYGKIIDSATNKPIDAASVQLVQNKFDSVTKKKKDVIVSGMLTSKKGEFSLENLSVMVSYKLRISAIGYKTIERKAAFELNMSGAKNGDYSSMISAVDKDLGNIKMEVDAQQLQDVTVASSKGLLTMSVDRKIFNVEKNLTSVGGTAVDVMKNVPSVNVDIDGNVLLRNAAPQIFVDGRPTTMTLEQIPADAISTIEVITNPSAKFDASGGGAGILNIVLKKNRKVGYNGNVRASIDSRGKPSFGGDFNLKQQKVNFFASTQIGFRKSISTVKTTRKDYIEDTVAYLTQTNGPVGEGVFGFGRLGMDYFIDNRNTISLSGNYSRGHFDNIDSINIVRDTDYVSIIKSDYGYRNSNSHFNFRNAGTTLSFKHNFAKANKELTADAYYNYSKSDNTNDFATQYFYTNTSPKAPTQYQQSVGGSTTKLITLQTDYVNPITPTTKFETGLRAAFRDFSSFNNNFIKAPNGEYIPLPGLNNNYKFTDHVLAAYGTFSQQIKKFSYNIGLRVESSKYEGTLINTGQQFSNEYPFSLFPSAFTTYKINDKEDMQLNYSRKINRPNFFQLIPFYDYSDSLNISKGNPNLQPEFTNSLEFSYQNQIAAGHNLLASVYFKNTNNLITRYIYKDANPNPYKLDSILITSYANASRSYTYGLELTSKDKITKWWNLTTNINLFHVTINADNIAGGVNSNQFSWFAKINNEFKLPKNYSIQLSGDYQAKTLILPGSGGGGGRGGGIFGGGNLPLAQGYINPLYGVDIAIKKEFLKNNAASLVLQFSDIFASRVNSTHSESVYYVQDYERQRDPQLVRLNFNWRFGKIDTSLFKRKNLKGDMENLQNSQQGAGGQ